MYYLANYFASKVVVAQMAQVAVVVVIALVVVVVDNSVTVHEACDEF